MTMILLVDDDDDTRAPMAQALRRHGYLVVEATHGAAALAMLRTGLRPRLIVIDREMPVMDGGRFREAQRALPAIAQIPIVTISGSEAIDNVVDGELPAAMLRKPVAIGALLAFVRLFTSGPGDAHGSCVEG